MFLFSLGWETPVEVILTSTAGSDLPFPPGSRTGLTIGNLLGSWSGEYFWQAGHSFSFRTIANTGKQNINLNIDYYAWYKEVELIEPRPYYATTAGTPLNVTGNFTPIPEPTTLILLGSGLLGWIQENESKEET